MIAWGLLLYYLALFVLIPGPGYELVARLAPTVLPGLGSPWIAYAVLMGAALVVAIGVSWIAHAVLAKDDPRWPPHLRRASGSLRWVDLLVPAVAVAAVCYAADQGVPLHGVLAAALPAVLLFLPSRHKPEDAPPSNADETTQADEEESEPSPPQGVELEPLIRQARQHAGSAARRDTTFESVVFAPSPLNDPRLADPEPYVVSWVVGREEIVRAERSAPENPWGQTADAELVAAIRIASSEPVLSHVAEQVAGTVNLAVELRVARLREFVNNAFEERARQGRVRAPILCLAQREGLPEERRVLLLALVLSHLYPELTSEADRERHAAALTVALWRSGEEFGVALEGVPGTDDVLPGLEWFTHPVGARYGDKRRYILLDAQAEPDRVILLSPGRPPAPIGNPSGPGGEL